MAMHQYFVRTGMVSLMWSLSLTILQAQAVPADLATTLDHAVAGLMDRYKVRTPFVVGVVVGDQVRYSKAFGSLDLEDDRPATTTTPFYIASSTKAFVGLTTAILAEQGIIDLDGTLAHYLPELHFLDTAIHPERITLRQLLTHTHGISNPVVGFNTAYTGLRTSTEELMTDLASESVAVPSTFDYSNDGYLITALILERVTGKGWRHLVQELILDPAGMHGTSARVSSYPKAALPPAFKGSRSSSAVDEAPFVKTDSTMHAAGGMISTVDDACRWIGLNLNGGRIGSEQVIPANAIARTHRAEVTLVDTFHHYSRHAYGLGWYVSDLHGHMLLHCFGAFLGARAHVSFMPQERIGVVVFSAEAGRAFNLPDMIADVIYATLVPDPTIMTSSKKLLEEQLITIQLLPPDGNKEEQVAAPDPDPSILERAAGAFSAPSLGVAEVISSDGRLHLRMGNIRTRMIPRAEAGRFKGEFPYAFGMRFVDDTLILQTGTDFTLRKLPESDMYGR